MFCEKGGNIKMLKGGNMKMWKYEKYENVEIRKI